MPRRRHPWPEIVHLRYLSNCYLLGIHEGGVKKLPYLQSLDQRLVIIN